MGPHGKFYWNELLTDDVEKAQAFYSATLGWTFSEMPTGGGHAYYVATLGGEPVAGMMDKTDILPPQVPPHWFSYINVDDVTARVELLKAAGGQVLREPFEIPGIGRIAIVSDATGAPFGIMTAAEQG
ncbi:VOC family protein [Xanthobacter autotrophicus DSM 597]|uniref:VOC family protein n=1 Tax=Xanthobacter TaxID=279 RepID=UPI001AEB12FD|nr:VOC family protein [Xanthobacter flavus]MBP2149938.1 putative enzyme related to lactoylglutathione lyase [Xanthobacter flavus]